MPDTADKLVEVAAWVGRAIGGGSSWLADFSTGSMAFALPAPLLADQLVSPVVQQVRLHAQGTGEAAAALEAAAQAGNKAATLAQLAQLANQLRSLLGALEMLETTLAQRIPTYLTGPGEQAALAFAEQLGSLVLDRLLFEQLERTYPPVLVVLKVLGLAEWERAPATSGNGSQHYVKKRLRLNRLPALLGNPAQHFQDSLGWGLGSFDPTSFFELYRDFQGEESGVELRREGPAQDPVVRRGHFYLRRQSALSPPGLEVGFQIGLSPAASGRAELGLAWGLQLSTDLDLHGDVAVQVTPPLRPSLKPPSGEVTGRLAVLFNRNPEARPVSLLGSQELLELRADDVELGMAVGVQPEAGRLVLEPLLLAHLKQAVLHLGSGQADGFVAKLLGGAKIEGTFDLALEWSPEQGLRVQASGGPEVALPLHLDLGPVRLDTLYLALRFQSDGSLALESSVSLRAQLGVLQVSVERLGAQVGLRFTDDASADLGPLDLSLGFKPPQGAGLALDAGVVKGGGYLYFDADRQQYAGALDLEVAGWLALKAVGLVTTKLPDGTPGFSLLVIITAEFSPGVQLGLGFTLLGVGGLLGLNRTVSLEPLAEGVRTGAVANVLFPKDVVANAPRIVSDLQHFFPPAAGTFLVGPMAKIGWGTPTLARISLGVILEFPSVSFTILGVLKVALPDEQAAILKLQVNFIGRLEPQNKLLWFYAELFDSRVYFLTLAGGMGLYVNWGSTPNFVLSVGGFHPQYVPPPLPFPAPPRLTVNLLNESYARVQVEGYFAITSNTVQFGAHAGVFFGLDDFSIEGDFGFDALFQFNPFHFTITFSVDLSVKVFGVGLFGVGFDGLLEGPSPWHVRGDGSISLLFFDISVPFEETWGQSTTTLAPPLAVVPLLEQELRAFSNWEAVLPGTSGLLVTLRPLGTAPADALVLHPVGYLRISQRRLPLDLTLEKVGNQKPQDATRLHVGPGQEGQWQLLGVEQEPFAIGQFKELESAKKLSAPGFQLQNSGLRVAAAGSQLRTSQAVRRAVRYETVVLDSRYRRRRIRFYQFFQAGYAALLGHYLQGGAVSQSVLSQSYRRQLQPFADVVAVRGPRYAVAFTATNQPLHEAARHFTSQASAEEFLRAQLLSDPGLTGSLHVLPTTELAA